jgi:membrane protein implicated in regulation of membrane protease activity
MEAAKIPLWINLASVVLAFILVYLLAKFNRETESSEQKLKQIKAVENSIRGKVLSPEKRRLKKAA